ncbi:hypothetical protein [Nonomuraea guangzhouensis]|uniref:Uncharacterized protein n=1 Tax=Nonomuraea guangzhouensis TaxID=1291555 RepID=A0ABW4GT93_9ACTN|nr:hypothetical protein [Nonomuraea guangzhouensis]
MVVGDGDHQGGQDCLGDTAVGEPVLAEAAEIAGVMECWRQIFGSSLVLVSGAGGRVRGFAAE